MARSLVVMAVVGVLVGCSSKRQPRRDQAAPPPSQAAAPTPRPLAMDVPPSLPPGEHLGFVPDSVAVRVGSSRFVLAVDLRAFKPEPLLALIPEQFACMRDLLEYMGVVVVVAPDSSHLVLYATQLSEINTRHCLDEIAPALGARTRSSPDGTYTIAAGGEGATLRWDGGVLTITQLGAPAPRPEPADAELLALMDHVPPPAPGFLLSKGSDDRSVTSLVAWFRLDARAISLTVRVEGSTPDATRTFIRDYTRGFQEGAASRHIHIDASWFKTTYTDRIASVEARIPLSVLGAAR